MSEEKDNKTTVTIINELEKAPAKKTAKKRTSKKADPRQTEILKNVAMATRDEHGLLSNVEYKFREDGTIDWKAMIPEEHIVANEEMIPEASEVDPDNLSELEDYQKLVLLAGIKEVAKIRGLIERRTRVDHVGEERAVVTTEVVFIPNYETGGGQLVYTDTASATIYNTGGFGVNYLETIASNRSFVRAVRNALRIDIAGNDEIKQEGFTSRGGVMSEEEIAANGSSPTDNLAQMASIKGYPTFEDFKKVLVDNGGLPSKNIPLERVLSWESWSDIDAGSVWTLTDELDKSSKKKKT